MAAITDLSSASSVAGTDNLVINQSGTDKKVTANKFAIVTATNTFDLLQTLTSGAAFGVAGNTLVRPMNGVLRQKLEQYSLASSGLLTISTDMAGRALVFVYNASDGKMALVAVEGGAGTLIYGDTGYFSGAVGTANRINVYAYSGGVYVQNSYGVSKVLSAYALL
jgi:hypothetical protein